MTLEAQKTRGSMVGIAANLFLAAAKILVGLAAGSVAIVAEGANNFSDAAAAVVSYLGFRFARIPAGQRHPFGHGRYEYIANFVVTLLILLMGFELLRSSVEKIIHPSPVEASTLTYFVLLLSIFVKCGLALYFKNLAQKTGADIFKATALDSASDTLATIAVLIGTAVGSYAHIMIDGWLGVLVSFIILYAGWRASKDSISLLIGEAADEETYRTIRTMALDTPGVYSVHDIMVHNYGANHLSISLHVVMDAKCDLLEAHHHIDLLEHQLMERFGGSAVIHLDPIDTSDDVHHAEKAMLEKACQAYNNKWRIHDYRRIQNEGGTYLYFDVVVPEADLLGSDKQKSIERLAKEFAKRIDAHATAVPQVIAAHGTPEP